MDLPAHYDAMHAAAVGRLAHGDAELDLLIDDPRDDRRGLTLLARPPAHVTAALEQVMADFRRSEPTQYYYPAADIHVTVLSIISCYRGFTLATVDPAAYVGAVGEIVRGAPPFRIRFAGLTASPGGIIVQGFPEGGGLETLRERTRSYFQNAGLQQSIDHRYSIQTAHSTIVRFRHPVRNPARLLATIEAYRRCFIGTFAVDAVELVYNDWYQKSTNTVLLKKYTLGPPTPPAWSC